MNDVLNIATQLKTKFGDAILSLQNTCDNFPTIWISKESIKEVLSYLKHDICNPYNMLFDLTCIDERVRKHRTGQPLSDFTIVYHLYSFARNDDVRIKVPLNSVNGKHSISSITNLWPAANWYEREVWDMFGVDFVNHPDLSNHLGMRRLLSPPWWEGHPLRKEHPARATEMPPFTMSEETARKYDDMLQYVPKAWEKDLNSDDPDTPSYMVLNFGPHHPGTHGLIRFILKLDGEEINDAEVDIGFHHRGAEKMGERQTWHTFIPYTDRIDYLGGVMNNLPYVLAVEQLAGIKVTDRVKVIRVMMAEFFRIASHLVWFGTFIQDLGAMTPVFFMFSDRERIFHIVEAICGGRMHPSWFRIGGVAQDLPKGWDDLISEFLKTFPKRLKEYEKTALSNAIVKARSKGIGVYSKEEAIEWGVTGPGLRATGIAFDFRKAKPYSGYDQFTFDIPTATHGDVYDRAVVRVEEMKQSLRIIEQCLKGMPSGSYMAEHPLTTPPKKENTLKDIETLINHFLGVSWGPAMPVGESFFRIEATKGANSYYLISDGSGMSYRTRIRTPSFAHVQMIPNIAKGHSIADLIAILGAVDYVLADIDR